MTSRGRRNRICMASRSGLCPIIMTIRILHFDVFTSQPEKGNPAGIVLSSDGLDGSAMQAVATAVGFNDTAFVGASEKADFSIRYFSPRREVDLCGHATVAAAIALHTEGLLASQNLPIKFSLETKAGVLPIALDLASGELIVIMSQTPSRFKEFRGDRERLVNALGISTMDLHATLPILYGSTGRWTLIVPVRDLDAIRRMRPQTEQFPDVLVDMPDASIHPFCMETIGANVDLHARHFSAPTSGTVEDPVTGTASGVLGAYYQEFVSKHRAAEQPLVIEQGYEVGREGRVLVWADKNDDHYAVRIAGTAAYSGEKYYS